MKNSPVCILLSQIILCLMHLGSANGLTVQVSEHGRDEQSCFYASIPCKTLTYALRLIETAKITNASVTFNVTYSQIINTAHFYNLSSSSVRNVTVVGYNDIHLYFQDSGSLQIHSSNSNSGLAWMWAKLEFVQVSPQDVTCKIPTLQQVGVYGDALSAFQCKFKSIGWSIYGIQNIVINGSVFGATGLCGLCTSVCISNTGKSDNEGVIIISNNDFQNCVLPPFMPFTPPPFVVLAISNAKFTSATILGNKFFGLLFSESLMGVQSAMSIQGTPTAIILKKNLFVGNSMAFIYIYVQVTNISIHNNTFHHNQQPAAIGVELSIIDIIFGSKSTYCCNNSFEISIINNDFKSNTNSLIFITLNHTSNTILSIIMTDLVVVNNSGIYELITLKNYLKPIVHMEMALLQVENNNAYFKGADSFEIPVKTSIIKLVNINKLFLIDSSFKNNLDTSLLVVGFRDMPLQLCILGTTVFQQNSGYLGGAFALHNTKVNVSCEGNLLFEKNEGIYGGALYLDNVDTNIPYPSDNMCKVTLTFVDNSARTAGNSIYYEFFIAWVLKEKCLLLHSNVNKSADIRTAANRMSFQNHSTVFPGQTIFLNGTIQDYFSNPSSCLVSIFILCNTKFSCFGLPIKLSGPDKILLISDTTYPVKLNTNMAVQSLKYPNLTEKFSLVLACDNIKSTIIPITITRCPNGFHYNTNTRMCQCAEMTKNMVCSIKFGAACIAHGYWYGELVVNDYNFTEYTIAQCAYPECKYSNVPCPPEMQSGNGFFMLNYENDSQCSYGRGGVLCRKCAQNFVFSFLSINCISEINCYSWQPFLIVFFGIFFQILIATFLLLVVRFKHALGSGFLYGPMLFLAVVSHLPLDNYSEFSTLSDAVSIVASIPLLNLKLFGRIPWCFFMIPKMYNYSLRFLGPMTVLVVLVSIAIFAQRCPFNSQCLQNCCPQNALRCWKAPPLKAVCILMLLSFWSLADTSINILTPTVFEFRESHSLYMVSIQPDIRYFSPQHLPVAIPALLVLLVLILPLVAVLLLSPFLQRVTNLYRIMPFLDEFQSCYEDRYRWYSGVYFIVWLVIVGIQGLPDFLLFTQTIFIILLCTQSLIRPYKSKLLNITDTLLLVDINFLISLVYKRTYSSPLSHVHTFSNLLIHALVIVPPVCAIVSVTCMLAVKLGAYNCIRTCLMRRPHSVHLQPTSHSQDEQQQPPDNVTVQDVWIQPDHDSAAEREPLIGIVNDN